MTEELHPDRQQEMRATWMLAGWLAGWLCREEIRLIFSHFSPFRPTKHFTLRENLDGLTEEGGVGVCLGDVVYSRFIFLSSWRRRRLRSASRLPLAVKFDRVSRATGFGHVSTTHRTLRKKLS